VGVRILRPQPEVTGTCASIRVPVITVWQAHQVRDTQQCTR